MKQAESASHMRELLIARGFDIPSRPLSLTDGQRWLVFERDGRQVGIDAVSGIWLRESAGHTWRCVATLHTMSGALLALDFLTEDLQF
jgi:hypothetical protein